jgi:hypothetical protein
MEYTENRKHRKSKSEKMNSNEFDGWQMQGKGRNEGTGIWTVTHM